MSIFRLFGHTTAAIFEVHWTIIKVCLSEVIIFRFHKWYTPRILLQFRTWWQTSRHWWKARALQRNCGICCIKGVHGWLHFFSCQLKYWTLNCCFLWFYDSICLRSLTVTIWGRDGDDYYMLYVKYNFRHRVYSKLWWDHLKLTQLSCHKNILALLANLI